MSQPASPGRPDASEGHRPRGTPHAGADRAEARPVPPGGGGARKRPASDDARKPAREAHPKQTVSPRPKAVDDDGRKLAKSVAEVRRSVDSLVGDGNRNVAQLRAASDNLSAAVGRIESTVEDTQALLERNEALAGESERLFSTGQRLEQLQDELEEQIRESQERCALAENRVDELREIKASSSAKLAELEKTLEKEVARNEREKALAGQLENRVDELQEENRELEQRVTRLREKHDRLEQMRAQFAAELAGMQGALAEAMALPQSSPSMPAAGSAPRARSAEHGSSRSQPASAAPARGENKRSGR